jgi:hypothetical protein
MVSNAEPQRLYRTTTHSCRWLRRGQPPAHRQRDAVLHRERQNQYRARLILKEQTHTLADIPPDDATPNLQTSMAQHVHEDQTPPQSQHSAPSIPERGRDGTHSVVKQSRRWFPTHPHANFQTRIFKHGVVGTWKKATCTKVRGNCIDRTFRNVPTLR